MNAQITTSRKSSLGWVALFAAGLLGLGGCADDPPPGITDPFDVEPEVVTHVSETQVEAGQEITVTFDYPPSTEAEGPYRSYVSWNPTEFEFVMAAPPAASTCIDVDSATGRITLDVDGDSMLPRRRIVLVFRALVKADSSGLNVFSDQPHHAS